MSTTTPNLGLFKYDPSTDSAQTFNITKALNENWDKIDDGMKANADKIKTLQDGQKNKADLVEGKVPSNQIPSLEYAAKKHASQHATGGSDPITPASIGAAPAYTYGTADLTAGSSALETGKIYLCYE